jgi:hypothetical protein
MWRPPCPDCGGGGRTETHRKLDLILNQLGAIRMSQAELNTDVQALQGVLSTIVTAEQANGAAVAAVAAALTAAQQANPGVDLSGLETLINGSPDGTTEGLVQAAASVTAGVAAVQDLVPPAPAPAS